MTLSKSLLAVAIASVIGLFSCSHGSSSDQGKFSLDSIDDRDSSIFLAGSPKGDTARLDYLFHFVYPTGNDTLLSNYVSAILGKDYVGLTPQEIRSKFRSAVIKNFKEEYEDADEEYLSYVTSQERVFHFQVDTICRGEGFLSVRYDQDEYTGGAHGIPTATCVNFDTKTGKQITESDLFTSGYQEKLSKKIMNALSSEDKDMLFSDTVEPNGNFLLTNEGITYVYNPYEITAFAAGIPTAFIPWSELSDIIKPYSLGEAYL